MLNQINYITGTGLFEDVGVSPAITRATLVFGENGRGKSTLAALLRSATGETGSSMSARNTLGGAIAQTASIDIRTDSGVKTLTYSDDVWSDNWADVLVFDAEFVSRNVYAGHGVSPDQRAGLLTFAVGEAAVQTKKSLDLLTAQANTATAVYRAKEAAVTQARGPYNLKQYRSLAIDPAIQLKIDAQRKRAAQAKDLAKLRSTASAQLIPSLQLDLPAFFEILRRSLADVSEAASAKVKAHITLHSTPNFENWLSAGLAHVTDQSCPFCGVRDSDQTLLLAYKSYFNDEYHALKDVASAMPGGVEKRLGEQAAELIIGHAHKAQAQLVYWRGLLELPETAFDEAKYVASVGALREHLLLLANAKGASPLDVLGTEQELGRATELWNQSKTFIEETNRALAECNLLIDQYKRSLETANLAEIEAEIRKLEVHKERHTPQATAQLTEFDQADQARNELTKQKESARLSLTSQMDNIFKAYGENINALLKSFGTQIEIRSLKQAFRGQAAVGRTEYELVVRGTPVALTATDGAHFGNTLSEGDKRALAYSFFIAKLMTTLNLGEKTVVIDDPVCSLDLNRRSATVRSLLRLAQKCRQLIVLAHDASFIKALGEELSKLPETKDGTSYLKVAQTTGNASTLVALDIDEECKSRHRRNIEVLAGYVADPFSGSAALASKSIRPVLEGYLRNRFPLHPPAGRMLGDVIKFIQKAEEPSPYCTLKPLVAELNDINSYTIQFMHEDGKGNQLVETELLTYCQRALALLDK